MSDAGTCDSSNDSVALSAMHVQPLADPNRLRLLEQTGLIRDSLDARVPTLDRVARLAARALRTPIAQVNLLTADSQVPAAAYVDSTKVDAAHLPLDASDAEPGGAWRTPVIHENSYCWQLLAHGRPLVVNDATTDPLVCESAATEAGVRSYVAAPLVAPDGAILGTVCVVDFVPRSWDHRDVEVLEELATLASEEVSTRLLLASSLNESEEQLRRAQSDAETKGARAEAVLASIADAFYLLDRDWRFTYVNDAAEPLLQTTRDMLLGATLWDAFPGVIGSEFEAPYREAMATGNATSAEAFFEPLDTWFDVRTYPWSGGLMVHFRDISERKGAEVERDQLLRELEVERARLFDVFRRAPSFIVAFRGADLVYEYVNEAYYQLVGHRQIIGKPLLEAIEEIRGQGFVELLNRVRVSGEPWVGREAPVVLQRTPGADLETRYLDMVFQPLTEADGTRSGVVVHGSDITEQVTARREVERLLGESERARADAEAARTEAEAANHSKSQFLAVMSHELRTPLNAIGGYAELLEMGVRGAINDQQRVDLQRIQTSQRHLLGLINEVLNYAKLENGTVYYDIVDVPIGEVLTGAESLVAPQVRARSLTLVVKDPSTSLIVRADPEKLRQILVNLLSNAIKFTSRRDGDAGRIELECDAAGDQIRVRVCDNGVGIAADKLSLIFDPFVQVRADLARTTEGTGLGLAISRDLARGMGGDLTVESTPGVGSTFTLTLPRANTTALR